MVNKNLKILRINQSMHAPKIENKLILPKRYSLKHSITYSKYLHSYLLSITNPCNNHDGDFINY